MILCGLSLKMVYLVAPGRPARIEPLNRRLRQLNDRFLHPKYELFDTWIFKIGPELSELCCLEVPPTICGPASTIDALGGLGNRQAPE